MRGFSAITLLVGVLAGGLLATIPTVRDRLPFKRANDPPPITAPVVQEHKNAHEEGSGAIHMTAAQIKDQGISVVEVGPGELPQALTAYGTVTAASNRVARVPARVVGTVAEMRKQLGDAVRKGEIVAVLDGREVADAKGEYLTAFVNAELQRTNFERSQNLRDKGVASESQYLQIRATNSETALRLELARQKLSALGLDAGVVARAARADQEAGTSSLRQYELRASLSGHVVERRVDVGMAVGKEGDPSDVYTIADLSVVWVEMAVSTADLGALKLGTAVSVLSWQTRGHFRAGRVTFISPILNPDTRSARVIAELPNEDRMWRPGAFVRADIDLGRDSIAVVVPRGAVHTMNAETVIFVRDEEGFKRRDVKLGRSNETAFEVLSGITAGEAVAVENSFLLKAELGKSGTAHDH